MVGALARQRDLEFARNVIEPPKPRVVSSGLVFLAWIAQAHQELDHD
jgi:hypothetical protein